MCDGEMGLTTPYGPVDTPDIFFQALSIVRAERTKVRRREANKHAKQANRNRN